MKKIISDNNYIKLFILYSLGSFLLLVNVNGIYWDDWTLVNQDFDIMKLQFVYNGNPFTAYLHRFLISHGIIVYRILLFILSFLTGIFFYLILKNSILKDKNSSFIIALIFLSLPMFTSKLALINFPYTLYFSIYMFSFYLLTIYMEKKRVFTLRIVILTLFLVSFLINSLLVFHGLALLYILYYIYQDKGNLKESIKILFLKYFDFIIITFIFFFSYKIFFVTGGSYASNGYNEIHLKNSLNSFIYFIPNLIDSIRGSYILNINILIISIMLLFPIFKIIQNINLKDIFSNKQTVVYLGLGVIIYFICYFPYQAVGKEPSFNEFRDRFQLLVPFGISFFLFFFLLFVSNIFKLKNKILLILFTVSLSIFISSKLYKNYSFTKDYFYQTSFINNLKADKEKLDKYNLFRFKEKSKHNPYTESLMYKRKVRFYEYNGILREVFNNNKKLGVIVYKKHLIFKDNDKEEYLGASDFDRENIKQIKVRFVYVKDINFTTFLKLSYYQFFNKDKFNIVVKELISLSYNDV